MPEPHLASKELRDLRRRFKRGYHLETAGRDSRLRVLDPEGKPVHRNGSRAPLLIHSTPKLTEWRHVENDLEKAGVLKEATPDKEKKRRSETMRHMVVERQKNRAEEAKKLREELAEALKPIGGFEAPMLSRDLGYIGAMIGRELGQQTTPDLCAGNALRVMSGTWVEPRYQEIWFVVVERLKETDEPIDEWFSLVREARGIPDDTVEVKRPVEGDWPFRVELQPIEALLVDHEYQRPVPWPFVRKLAARYDESLVGTIDVAERRRGAVFAILDGQLRYEASKLVGKKTIWCSIYSGLDRASEARFFLHKNKDRKAVHPFYTFRARLVSLEPGALEIERIVKANGYQLAISGAKPGTRLEGNISAIAAVETAYNYLTPDDQECLSPTLETLAASTLGMEQGQSNVLIRGLARFFSGYGLNVDRKRLENVITKAGPTKLLALARENSRHSGGNAENYMTRVIADEYNRGLDRTEKLERW